MKVHLRVFLSRKRRLTCPRCQAPTANTSRMKIHTWKRPSGALQTSGLPNKTVPRGRACQPGASGWAHRGTVCGDSGAPTEKGPGGLVPSPSHGGSHSILTRTVGRQTTLAVIPMRQGHREVKRLPK